MGAGASGGMDALFGHRTMADLAGAGPSVDDARLLELTLGYGLGVFGDRFTATTSRHHREPRAGRREGSCDVSVVRRPRPGLAARESSTVSAPPLRGCADSRPLVHLPYPVDERLRGDSANRTRKGDPDPRSGGYDPVDMNARAGKPVPTVGSASTGRIPTPVEPLSDVRAPRGERRLSAPHPGIGHRGWPPSEPRSTTHRPPPALTLGAPAPACYRRAGRVPDDVPATPWRSRP